MIRLSYFNKSKIRNPIPPCGTKIVPEQGFRSVTNYQCIYRLKCQMWGISHYAGLKSNNLKKLNSHSFFGTPSLQEGFNVHGSPVSRHLLGKKVVSL